MLKFMSVLVCRNTKTKENNLAKIYTNNSVLARIATAYKRDTNVFIYHDYSQM